MPINIVLLRPQNSSSLKLPMNKALLPPSRYSVAFLHAILQELLWLCAPLPCYEGEAKLRLNQGLVDGGGFPDLDLSFLFCPSLSFGDFSDFSGIFLICPGIVRGFSRLVLLLFLGLLTAPTRNSPERVRDTIRTFPEKSGKPPGLETPRLTFSQLRRG